MINSLEGRLRLRKVDIRTRVRATAISCTDDRVASVETDQGRYHADAVVGTCDPAELYQRLLPRTVARRERRRAARLRPALAPTVGLQWLETDDRPVEPTETVRHRAAGGPRIDYTLPLGSRLLQISHDFGNPRPDAGAGLAWRGFSSWLDRPPTTSELTGLFTAGPYSRGGNTPSHQILSGALAAYACQRLINPDKPLEPR